MKYDSIDKYEKPDLEELELVLEGSFLDDEYSNPGVDKGDENEGGGWD